MQSELISPRWIEALQSNFNVEPDASWTRMAFLSEKRQLCAALPLDDHNILVTGGSRSNRSVESSVEVYDTHTESWIEWPSLNHERYLHAATICNGKVYVVGGFDGSRFLDSIECLDLASTPREWVTVDEKLPVGVTGCAIAAVGKFVYVIGGWDSQHRLQTTTILNTETGSLMEGPFLTSTRSGCSAAVMDATIWLVGGYDDHGKKCRELEFLDTTLLESRWMLSSMTPPIWRSFPAVATADRCLIVTGGRNGHEQSESSVEVLDLKRGKSWHLPNLISARYAHATFMLNKSHIVVLGGSASENMESFHLLPATKTDWANRIAELAKETRELKTKLQELKIQEKVQLEKAKIAEARGENEEEDNAALESVRSLLASTETQLIKVERWKWELEMKQSRVEEGAQATCVQRPTAARVEVGLHSTNQ